MQSTRFPTARIIIFGRDFPNQRLQWGIGSEVLSGSSHSAEFPTHTLTDSATHFCVELLLAGVPIERRSILLGHQSVRITEKHHAPCVNARQEQLEADIRRIWPKQKRQGEVHSGYTGAPAQIIPFKSRRKMVEAGGVGILSLIDNTQLIDFIRRQKHQKLQICRTEVHGGDTESSATRGVGIHARKRCTTTPFLDRNQIVNGWTSTA